MTDIDSDDLTGVLSTPRWLRDLGRTSWLLVALILLVVAVWLMSLTEAIVAPLITATVALGDAGTDAAIGMIVVQLLANGVLQQLVQPIAYGAALGIHPLAVLVVTIAGGSLFGAAGLILAAPVTSAVVRVSADLARARGTPLGAEAAPVQTAAGVPA